MVYVLVIQLNTDKVSTFFDHFWKALLCIIKPLMGSHGQPGLPSELRRTTACAPTFSTRRILLPYLFLMNMGKHNPLSSPLLRHWLQSLFFQKKNSIHPITGTYTGKMSITRYSGFCRNFIKQECGRPRSSSACEYV